MLTFLVTKEEKNIDDVLFLLYEIMTYWETKKSYNILFLQIIYRYYYSSFLLFVHPTNPNEHESYMIPEATISI